MGGHKTEETSYITHVIVFLVLTLLMYMFAYLLVDHSKSVPSRVDTVHAGKQE
jgi:hypothetical protein